PVGTVGAAAQDQGHVRVAEGGDQARPSVGPDPEEGLRGRGRGDRIERDLDAAIGAVLEADRHGQAGGELAVDLALRGAVRDHTPAYQARDVLRTDRHQERGGAREAELGFLAKETTGEDETGGEGMRSVQVRIIDQALPADGGAEI